MKNRKKQHIIKYLVFFVLLHACVFDGVAKADEATANEHCNLLVQNLPESIRDLPVRSCERPIGSQTTVSVQLSVLAGRVLEVQRELTSAFDMKALKFVCCGYETQPVNLTLPKDHPLVREKLSGVSTAILLSFSAAARIDDKTGQYVKELGKADGSLKLELVEF